MVCRTQKTHGERLNRPGRSQTSRIEALDLIRIYALPYARNAPSSRVLEKAGYALEGRMRKSAIKDGEVLDQLLYAITRD